MKKKKKIFNQLSEWGKNYSSSKVEYQDECIEDLEKQICQSIS